MDKIKNSADLAGKKSGKKLKNSEKQFFFLALLKIRFFVSFLVENSVAKLIFFVK